MIDVRTRSRLVGLVGGYGIDGERNPRIGLSDIRVKRWKGREVGIRGSIEQIGKLRFGKDLSILYVYASHVLSLVGHLLILGLYLGLG